MPAGFTSTLRRSNGRACAGLLQRTEGSSLGLFCPVQASFQEGPGGQRVEILEDPPTVYENAVDMKHRLCNS